MGKRNLFVWILLISFAMALSGCGETEAEVGLSAEQVDAEAHVSTEQEEKEVYASTEQEEDKELQDENASDSLVEVEHRDGMYGVSDKDVLELGDIFERNLIGKDVVGSWRLSTVTNNVHMVEYALSYYENYMNKNEVHVIINSSNKTTTCINPFRINHGEIWVTVYEYVDGNEQDMSLLCSDNLLEEYVVYIDNGDIEKIQLSSEEPTDSSTEEKDNAQQEPIVEESETQEEIVHRDGIYGISDKNINDLESKFSVSDVRNDVTGKWRISSVAETFNIEEYALSYYDRYFTRDDQIHGIVNFNLNTTTCISVMSDTMLDVSIHEYVKGEEHDAGLLFGGTLLAEYFIYLDNGDIEKVQ